MTTVAYDDRSFLVDGRRVWLSSGALHYFRIPKPLWRDRLTKALRGGLNCIETYVAWNVHEPVEGEWDFSGDNDVAEFIQQAGDLGLYVIVRPGPFICAEWDFGGLPGWLRNKANIRYRSSNAVFTHYYDKYFRQLLPRLVDLQVSRGGNIIAIQNENEYFSTTMPDRMEYLNFISTLYRKAGFDIPILTCNQMTEPQVDGAVECLNCWGRGNSQIKALRRIQPDKPLLATEFWSGWFDEWGGEHAVKDPRETARRAMELLGGGAQINYYMYHGGTNFGFRGGRTIGSDHTFMTTSYDYDAPVAEGGGLTRKYYLLRLVNLLARQLAPIFAAAEPVPSAVCVSHTASWCCEGEAGTVVVVSNGGDDAVDVVSVAMPDGRVLEVDLSHFGAVALVQDAMLDEKHVLDYSNLTPLGLFGGKTFILHGVAGRTGVVSLNGREMTVQVPDGDAPVQLDVEGLTVLVMNSSLAERVWRVDDVVAIGPAYAGETLDDLVMQPGAKKHFSVDAEGKLHTHRIKATRRHAAVKAPTLGAWEALGAPAALADPAAEFKRLDRVRNLTRQGVVDGYGWYRVGVELKRAAKKMIFLPGCEDRAAIFLNGRKVGQWGRGAGARRVPTAAPMKAGLNELTFLVDDLGRFNFGLGIGEPKGIWDDVYVATHLRPRAWRLRAGTEKDFSRRLIPRHLLHLSDELTRTPPMVCETSFTLSRPLPVHLQFSDLSQTVAIYCNDRPVGFFAGAPGGFGDVTLKREVKKGVNRLRLLIWPEATARQLNASILLHRLDDNLTAGRRWFFRPWAPPADAAAGAAVKGLPGWFRASFKAPSVDQPLFVRIDGAVKGQVFLNGRNLGRYWTIGPQQLYYLPEPWLESVNELLLFDEEGREPVGTKLEFHPDGPYVQAPAL